MLKKLWLILIGLGFALFLILLLAIVGLSVHGQDYRYLKIKGTFQFEYSVDLPYTEIREMGWNAQNGFYELDGTNPLRSFYLIDRTTFLHGVAYSSEIGCFILFMRQEYGSDGQPHVEKAEWISCEP